MTDQATNLAADVDTSKAGVAAEPAVQSDDDLDTSAIDRMEAPDEDAGDEPKPEGEGGEPDADADKAPKEDADLVEVEAADGTKVKVPAVLKDDFLRHADYTRKTQEIAADRRQHEEEVRTWQSQQAESRAALPEEYAAVAVAKASVTTAQADVAEFEKIDWATWRAQTASLALDDPNRVQYAQYRAAYDAARDAAADAQRNLAKATETLSAKEQTRLEEQRAVQETELAKARQQTSEALIADGWDQTRFAKVATFAVNDLGYSPEELKTATDPRAWRMADKAMSLQEENTKLRAALKQNNTAASNLKAQEVKPNEPAKGAAQPTRVRDDVSTKAWMERRAAQLAKRRA